MKTIRVRVTHKHHKDCEGNAVKHGWGSAWWLNGQSERRSQTGRAHRHGHDVWLKARCVFDQRCHAVHQMDITDALLPARPTRATRGPRQ